MSWLFRLGSAVIVLLLAYQATNFYKAYLERNADHKDRVEFLRDDKVYRMPFLAGIIEESRRIANEGIWLPSLAIWIERSIIYRTLTLSNTNLQIGFGVIVIVAMYLTYKFLSDKYQTDSLGQQVERMNAGMATRNDLLQKIREREALRAGKSLAGDDDESEVEVAAPVKARPPPAVPAFVSVPQNQGAFVADPILLATLQAAMAANSNKQQQFATHPGAGFGPQAPVAH